METFLQSFGEPINGTCVFLEMRAGLCAGLFCQRGGGSDVFDEESYSVTSMLFIREVGNEIKFRGYISK